jgi:alpha-galactosidase
LSTKVAFAQWTPTPLRPEDFAAEAWDFAQPVQLSRYWSGVEAPVDRHAEAKTIWSAEGLHVLFECQQREPMVVTANPQTVEKTIGLWDRDVGEIFVGPDLSKTNKYFEFEAAPTGEWLDVAIEIKEGERFSDWEFHSGMRVAANQDGGLLTISMHIPWSTYLPKPRAGEKWRINFFRCIGSGAERGYLAWQPTLTDAPNFHVPEMFGWLQFV